MPFNLKWFLFSFKNVLFHFAGEGDGTETKSTGENKDNEKRDDDEQPPKMGQISFPSTSRAYSPIIEDPRERDSRPLSTELVDDKEVKLDDEVSISSRATSIASRAMSPDSNLSRTITGSRPISPEQSATMEPSAQSNVIASGSQLNEAAEKDETKSSSEMSSQPIFKPLVTEKGKSKTTGKSIGGWI